MNYGNHIKRSLTRWNRIDRRKKQIIVVLILCTVDLERTNFIPSKSYCRHFIYALSVSEFLVISQQVRESSWSLLKR